MNIVVDGYIFQLQARGGISRIFHAILPRMCDLDESLHITLVTHSNMAVKQPLPDHVRIEHRILPDVRHRWRWLPGRTRQVLKESAHHRVTGQGDVWHTTYFTTPQHWRRGHYVVSVYDMVYELFREQGYNRPQDEDHRQQVRRCVQAADAIIAISEVTKRDIQRVYGVDAARIHAIPLGCSADFIRTAARDAVPPSLLAQPFVLYVGKRGPRKNFETLLEAYRRWPRRSEVTLAVVGDPWSSEEQRRLEDWNLQDRVHLLSGVGDGPLTQLYNEAAAFVYPSIYEGFGIPLLEAMNCGCPVIASDIPTSHEVAGDYLIYFDPPDVDGLQAALDTALAEGRDSARVKAGFERAKLFSWDHTAQATLDLYRSLAGNHS
ncbi:MAG: glycosyltransferase family 4 protein [Anaerolineae bacterium]|nr:glycosyltransferase family 4 protein [Anaerolineae bacterium]